jgi:MFS family permease
MLDGTVVGTALPRIVEQIGGGGSWYVWLVTAYLLTSSVSR